MKKRLDVCVMEKRGFSRNYAADVIKDGLVFVRGEAETKPGKMVLPSEVNIIAEDMPYVSRGGYKLAAALDAFEIDVCGYVCLDVGASAGGFTDCLLKRGAGRVIAVDAGHNQLAGRLRDEPRVLLFEGTDIRGFALPGPVDFAVCDVSFISVTKVIPSVKALLAQGGGFVTLVKPQFETNGRHLSKGHIVKDRKARESAVEAVRGCLESEGFTVKGLIESPTTGRDGNVEYLIYSLYGDFDGNGI